MHITKFIKIANNWGEKATPFFFLIDFEMEKPVIYPIDEAAAHGYYFSIHQFSNKKLINTSPEKITFNLHPIAKTEYEKAFQLVQHELNAGNSYLLNLTFPTLLEGDIHLPSLYATAAAPYKLLKENEFVLYSPECFIKTNKNKIYSYPMKGSIEANIPNAKEQLLNNQKELYEHNTIVDLIRNDLAIVARNINIERFRYVEKIKKEKTDLLQVSSAISGTLPGNWQQQIGNLLVQLLPAGSVSGAPKQKTCEIIRKVEVQKRGYYTGIFGIFDGTDINSAVNIRYVEKTTDGFFYRSGGGITTLSNMEDEYNELKAKVYVPIIGNNSD